MATTPLPGIGRVPTGDPRVRREIASLIRLFGTGLQLNAATGAVEVNNSALSLAGLGDVSVSGPTNGQVLTYNAVAHKWEATTPAVGTVTAVTGTAPIVSSGGTTPAISLTLSGPSLSPIGGLHTVGLSVTITTAKLTAGGTNGSMTFTNGLLTAQTAAT